MITTNGLMKTYGGNVALDDVSITIPDGAICAIVGPNVPGRVRC